MSTLLITFLLLLSVMVVMSIGIFFGRDPIAGSCGGLKAFGEDSDCEICGGDLNKCPRTKT